MYKLECQTCKATWHSTLIGRYNRCVHPTCLGTDIREVTPAVLCEYDDMEDYEAFDEEERARYKRERDVSEMITLLNNLEREKDDSEKGGH